MEFDKWIESVAQGRARNQGVEIAMREAWSAGMKAGRTQLTDKLIDVVSDALQDADGAAKFERDYPGIVAFLSSQQIQECPER